MMVWVVAIGLSVIGVLLLLIASILAAINSRLDEATAQLHEIKALSRRA